MDTLGERLKKIREGQTQAWFAKQLGIPPTTLSNYENGKTELNFAIIDTITTSFCVNTDWLLFGRGPMHPGEQPEQTAQAQDAPMPIQEGTCAACSDLKRELTKKNQQFDNAFEKLVEVSQEAMRLTEEVGQLRLENLKLTHQLETARQMCRDYASSAKNADSEGPLFDEQQIIQRSEPPRIRR